MLFRNLLLIAGALAIVVGVSMAGMLLLRARPAPHSEADARGLFVLVAARAVSSGSVLQSADLAWKPMENHTAPPGGLTRSQASITEFVGSITRRDLAAGQIVARDAVFDASGSRMLAAALSPGLRAVTIDVDAAQGGAGLILPDDRVDVILVSQPAGTSSGGLGSAHAAIAGTLLRNVRVMAVDHTVQRPNGSATQSEAKGPESNMAGPKTITLEVTERDAQRLFLATQVGKIELSLRSLAHGSAPDLSPAGDDASEALTPGSSATPSHGPRRARSGPEQPRPSSSDAGAPIVILRGSKTVAQ